MSANRGTMPSLSVVSPPRRRPSTEVAFVALFREAAAAIEAHPAGAITLHSLPERLSSSPRQLRRAFAEVGGTTFGSFLREVRMARAAGLLTETSLPVHEIAAGVGYTEPSQFTKASAARTASRRPPTGYAVRVVRDGQLAQRALEIAVSR